MKLGNLTRTLLAPVLATGLVAASATGAPADDAAKARTPVPQRIALPDGFAPEGIATGMGFRAFLGSLADGDIYSANLRTGGGHVIHQGDGTPATGLKLDRAGRLWVSGGDDGDAKVVNTRTGRSLAHYNFANGSTFINDVVLLKGAAWFTDSQRAVLYKVAPLRGRPADANVRRVPLTGGWRQVPNEFNANGISTTPGNRALLVVQSITGKLFRVNPSDGVARRVGLHGYLLTNGDGMLRRGRTLYVAQNQDNKVAVLRLSKSGKSGRLVRTITARSFDVPTTIAAWGGGLYLPNARFSTPSATKYWITRVPR
jgi:sugar lactone lactonase YvrE